MNEEKDRTSIQSVSRAFAILRCFEGRRELGLTEISRMVGLHKSTTAGIVNTLKAEKVLETDAETGKLRLGIELFRLSVNVKWELRDICRPYLDELLKLGGETVNLAVLDDGMVTYVEKIESLHSVRICTKIGQSKPFYCTAVGKAIYAFLNEDEVRRAFESTEIRKYTDYTITSFSVMMEHLRQVRKQGYAIDDEELEYGLICVAAPIFNRKGRPIASLSMSGPSIRMGTDKLSDVVSMVCSAAYKITKELLIRF